MVAEQHPDVWQRLAAEFEPYEVSERPGRGGGTFRYADARAVQNRLDSVVGPEGWHDAYDVLDQGTYAVRCKLTILGVTKEDVGYPNNPPGSGSSHELLKESFSDALRRTASKFGVGRYLYRGGGAPTQTQRPTPIRQPQPAKAPAAAVVDPRPADIPAWAESVDSAKHVYRVEGWEVRFSPTRDHPVRFLSLDSCPEHDGKKFECRPKADGSPGPLGHRINDVEACFARRFK